MSIEERPDVLLTALAILVGLATVAETAPRADDSVWMQVPGTCLAVPLIPGPGPLATWRIGRDGLDVGLTVGELERITSSRSWA